MNHDEISISEEKQAKNGSKYYLKLIYSNLHKGREI